MNNQPTLKQLLARDRILVAPCCYDMISAKLIEQAGFEAVYLDGTENRGGCPLAPQ